jgi:glycosyltransferase involved in cell wall biosynthesis
MPSTRKRERSPILVVAPQPFYSDRGTPIAVRQVLSALSELGLEVDVLTFPGGRDVDLPGVRILRCPNPLRFGRVPIGLSLPKLALDASLARLLAAQIEARRYAYIHAVEESAFFAVPIGARAGVPVLYDMQSSLPEQLSRYRLLRAGPLAALARACERWLLRRVHLTVASCGLGERVTRLVPHRCVREWRYASPLGPVSAHEAAEVRRELGVEDDQRLVLYSGTFEAYQGLSTLIEALPRVTAEVPGTVLALVGDDGSGGRELRARAAHLGLGAQLRIVERQPRERIGGFLAAAEVLVSPRAYGTNLPLKIFDYLAAGKAMVVAHSPAAETLLAPDRAAVVGHSPDAIAGSLIELLRDPVRAATLGRNARRYAEEHLSSVQFSSAVAELVDHMAVAASPVPT